MAEHSDPLSLERIKMARETLSAAFKAFLKGAPAAIDGDGPGSMSEAKRNLTALVITLLGRRE